MNNFIFFGLLGSLIFFQLSYIFSVPVTPIEITAEFVGNPNSALSSLQPLFNAALQAQGPVRVQGMSAFPQQGLRYEAVPVGGTNPSIINPLGGIPASQSDIRRLLQAPTNLQGQNFLSPQVNQVPQVPQVQVQPLDVQQVQIQPSQVQAAAVDSVIVALPTSATNPLPQPTLAPIAASSPVPVPATSTVLPTTNIDASYLFTALDSTGFTASTTQSLTAKPTLDPTLLPSPVIPLAASPTVVSSSSASALSSTPTVAPSSTSTTSSTATYTSTSTSSIKSVTQATPIVQKNAMVEDPSQPSGQSSLLTNSNSKNSLAENTFSLAPPFISSSKKKQLHYLFIALCAVITLYFV